MKKTFIFIFCFLVLFLLFAGGGFFFSKERDAGKRLKMQLKQERIVLEKWQKKFEKALLDKEELEKETKGLRSNILRYLDINNELQKGSAKVQSSEREVERLKKIVYERDGRIEKLEKIFKAQKSEQKIKDAEREKELEIQKKEEGLVKIVMLRDELELLEDTLTQERGLYHYNLGVAYTKARLYGEALAAYQKSLEFQPDNYEAHYNLGLLFGEIRENLGLAVSHYRRYLELNPKAEDFEEIRVLIGEYIKTSMSSGAPQF